MLEMLLFGYHPLELRIGDPDYVFPTIRCHHSEIVASHF